MPSSTRPSIYVFSWFCVANNIYLWVAPQNSCSWNICRINHFRAVHSQQNNMLSYIMVLTNECYHIITLVFLLPHFSLNFCLTIPAATPGVSPSLSIYNNYIDETHYKSWIDFSQHASVPRHHPLYAMSPSIKPSIYVFKRFFVTNSMYLWVAHHKILAVEIHVWLNYLRMVSLSTK
jgi:hypothetical protein